jgi:hypothetical protein
MKKPEDWDESTEERKELLVKDARDMLRRDGVVPEGSYEAFAVVWDYERRHRRNWNGRSTDSQSDVEEDASIEAA